MWRQLTAPASEHLRRADPACAICTRRARSDSLGYAGMRDALAGRMKKTSRRISLSTQTLRTLVGEQLEAVQGGSLDSTGTQFCPVPPIHDASERVCIIKR
jgi:hypothetical protein